MTRREQVTALFMQAFGKRRGPKMLEVYARLVFGPGTRLSALGPDEWRFLAECAEGILRRKVMEKRQKARQYYWRKKRSREGWGV